MFSMLSAVVLLIRTLCPYMMEEHVTSTLRVFPLGTEAQGWPSTVMLNGYRRLLSEHTTHHPCKNVWSPCSELFSGGVGGGGGGGGLFIIVPLAVDNILVLLELQLAFYLWRLCCSALSLCMCVNSIWVYVVSAADRQCPSVRPS